MPGDTLTRRQRQILDFVERQHRQTGVAPSTYEIQEHFGFASQTAAVNHLRALERKGAIARLAGKARGILLPGAAARGALATVPVFGRIPAGHAVDVEHSAGQQSDERLGVDLAALGLRSGARTFALRVQGDSMTGAAIVDGDLVILEVREPADGDIVAALIDGESTLKRYVVNRGKPYLKAENPAYPDLLPARELVIQGVMVGLVRRGA
ncbi:MAG TPA: transcriptional repressor LexA [Opitutaceae bacterium]|nr:transcriptional repressor LexA [Opitutaceae bacterium]